MPEMLKALAGDSAGNQPTIVGVLGAGAALRQLLLK